MSSEEKRWMQSNRRGYLCNWWTSVDSQSCRRLCRRTTRRVTWTAACRVRSRCWAAETVQISGHWSVVAWDQWSLGSDRSLIDYQLAIADAWCAFYYAGNHRSSTSYLWNMTLFHNCPSSQKEAIAMPAQMHKTANCRSGRQLWKDTGLPV